MITPTILRSALMARVEEYFDVSSELVRSSDLSENILLILADLRKNPRKDKLWLVLTLLLGHLPSREQFANAELWLKLSQSDAELGEKIITEFAISTAKSGTSTDVVIANNRVVVVLTNIFKTNLHTGVQRIARDLCNELKAIDSNIMFANISRDGFSISPLEPDLVKVMLAEEFRLNNDLSNQVISEKVLIPLNCKILIPEVPLDINFNSRLSVLAENSSNEIACLGYDLIPILSPEFVTRTESEQFTHYLSMCSQAKIMLCISDHARAEFKSYFDARGSVGATSPKTIVVEIPVNQVKDNNGARVEIRRKSTFNVLTVGTVEPRKGQIETLLACKKLWDEDVDLRITFVGNVHSEINELWVSLTKDLSEEKFCHLFNISDKEIVQLYSNSDMSIFVSKHEGYGLPIIESIMHGTPVLTTNFSPIWPKVRNSGAIGISTVDPDSIALELRKAIKSRDENQPWRVNNQNLDVPSSFEYATAIYREIMEL